MLRDINSGERFQLASNMRYSRSQGEITIICMRRTNLGVIQEQDIFNNSKVYHSFSASDGGLRQVVCQLSVPKG